MTFDLYVVSENLLNPLHHREASQKVKASQLAKPLLDNIAIELHN